MENQDVGVDQLNPSLLPTNGVLNWKHLKDWRLYSDNDYAVETLKIGFGLRSDGFTHKATDKRIDFHCFWFGEIGRKQIFSIKSFLITQDLSRCNVILWLDINCGYNGYLENELIQSILPFIEVRPYDPEHEIVGTIWEHDAYIADYRDSYYNLVKRADAFRFLVLNKYGGVYFDLDIMFLKDITPLTNTEFCYAWEIQPFANSAIFNLNKNSELSKYLLKKCLLYNAVSPWEIFKYDDPYLKDLCVLPCAFFDPIWQGLNNTTSPCTEFSDFFRAFDDGFYKKAKIQSYVDFYPGCFAFHWHNQWDAPEYENSYFGIFEKEINDEFEHLQLLIN